MPATLARGRSAIQRLPAALRTREALIAAGLTLLFLVGSAIWLAIDNRLPNGDAGRHLNFALIYYDRLRTGYLSSPITSSVMIDRQFYPPLVHLVGAAGFFVGGVGVAQAVLAQNLVFVPLLALGVYGTGTLAFDRRVGLLAVVFALGTPMVISLFHEFMLDTPEAALAAMSVWLLLLSDRFRRPGVAILAGIAVGLGCLTKQSFPVFVLGLLAVMLVRGGWRNWRGLLLFAVPVLILIEPWYSAHLLQLTDQTAHAANPDLHPNPHRRLPGVVYQPQPPNTPQYTWYGWALVNHELYLPLTLLFITGLGAAIVTWVRRRGPLRYVPELVVGVLFSYFGISYFLAHDPRYLLPAVVYMSVLGTAWLARLPGRAWMAGTAVLAAIVLVNAVFVNTRSPARTIDLPGAKANPVLEGHLVVVNKGYDTHQPNHVGQRALRDLLTAARKAGPTQVLFQPETMNGGRYNLNGLVIWARSAGLGIAGFSSQDMKPNAIFVVRRPWNRHACIRVPQALPPEGIFLYKGALPGTGVPTWCPPGYPLR